MSVKKIVFFDIDGTIWDWKEIIPPSAKEAIKALAANGHIPIICTGRARGNIVNKELFELGFRGIIGACGCYGEIDGSVIFDDNLPNELVRNIIRYSEEYKVPIVLEGSRYHCIAESGFEKDGFVDMLVAKMGDSAVPLKEYRENMKINKFSGDVINISDYDSFKEKLLPYFDFIEHGLTLNIKHNEEAPNGIRGVFEAVRIGSSKAKGIKKVCQYLGIDMAHTYAIGDSNNDLEMLKAVNTGIAMGNASDQLKEAADYITDDIWSDGLKKALEHFELI